MGLDPRTPKSLSEPKADAQPLSHPGIPRLYLFVHDRHRERGIDIGRGRSRLPMGSLMWDSISGSQDHDLS